MDRPFTRQAQEARFVELARERERIRARINAAGSYPREDFADLAVVEAALLRAQYDLGGTEAAIALLKKHGW